MNHLLADDSHEIPILICCKNDRDDVVDLSSADVVIGALSVTIVS